MIYLGFTRHSNEILFFGITESTVVCRWLCSADNWKSTFDINWTQREQEITSHASRLIKGVGTEAPKFEICNVLTAVLLKILIFCYVTPYVVCVASAILRVLGAFLLHFDCNTLSRSSTMLWSLKYQPPLTHNRAIYHSTPESSA